MRMKSYVISGIKPVVAEEWYKELQNNAKFSMDKKTGNYSMRVSLSMIDAIKARIDMIKYNFSHRNKLKFKRYRGKHV